MLCKLDKWEIQSEHWSSWPGAPAIQLSLLTADVCKETNNQSIGRGGRRCVFTKLFSCACV